MARYVHTPQFRGGSGDPLVLLNGGINTWTSWLPQLPFLTERFDVLAPTHIGNAGAPSLPPGATMVDTFVDAAEAAMDKAGFAEAHIAGYSLGGWVAMELASRGRALSVYSFAPAGGWESEASLQRLRGFFKRVSLSSRYGKYGTPLVAWIPAVRRLLLRSTNLHGERTPAAVVVRLIHEVAASEVPRAIKSLAFQPFRTPIRESRSRLHGPKKTGSCRMTTTARLGEGRHRSPTGRPCRASATCQTTTSPS